MASHCCARANGQRRLYTVTDWLGLVPIAVCVGFGILGLAQWVRRKSIVNVDRNILLLSVGLYSLYRGAVLILCRNGAAVKDAKPGIWKDGGFMARFNKIRFSRLDDNNFTGRSLDFFVQLEYGL